MTTKQQVTPLDTLNILRTAKKLIRAKSRWVKGMTAADKHGVGCLISSVQAVKFCADGALRKASLMAASPSGSYHSYAANYTPACHALEDATEKATRGHTTSYTNINDRRNGHERVMKIFDIAIATTAKAVKQYEKSI